MSPVPASLLPPRIAEIQQRFGAAQPRSASTASAATFSAALGNALGADALDADAGRSLGVAQGVGFDAGVGTGATVGGADVVATATKYLGVPYRWGGTDPSSGLDCSGLVQRVYRELGIELPRVSRDQARQGSEVASLAEARPGDLVSFGSPVDHIGIYVGGNKMLHAPRTGEVVKIGEITRPIATIRQVLPEPASAQTIAAGVAGIAGVAGAPRSLAAPTPISGSAEGAGATGIAGAEPYEALFVAAGRRHGFNPTLLAAIAKTESNFNPNAVSPVGAQGLMQFMPATARGLGVNPLDPAQAIDGAARYLRQQVDRFGSIEAGLAAYNAGPGNVSKYGGIPPFTETRNYVTKVTDLLNGRSAFASPVAV